MLPVSVQTSASSSAASSQDSASKQGFFTGDFTAATGSARATGSDLLIPLLLVAGLVWLVMRKRK